MDRIPEDYCLHNLPLLILSGLARATQSEPHAVSRTQYFLQEGGFRIKVDVPVVEGRLAERLLEAFQAQDASNVPWHAQSVSSRNGRLFKISTVGRVG